MQRLCCHLPISQMCIQLRRCRFLQHTLLELQKSASPVQQQERYIPSKDCLTRSLEVLLGYLFVLSTFQWVSDHDPSLSASALGASCRKRGFTLLHIVSFFLSGCGVSRGRSTHPIPLINRTSRSFSTILHVSNLGHSSSTDSEHLPYLVYFSPASWGGVAVAVGDIRQAWSHMGEGLRRGHPSWWLWRFLNSISLFKIKVGQLRGSTYQWLLWESVQLRHCLNVWIDVGRRALGRLAHSWLM